METISAKDLAEVKELTIEEITKYLKACEANRVIFIKHIDTLTGSEKAKALITLKKYDAWVSIYSTEIEIRSSFSSVN